MPRQFNFFFILLFTFIYLYVLVTYVKISLFPVSKRLTVGDNDKGTGRYVRDSPVDLQVPVLLWSFEWSFFSLFCHYNEQYCYPRKYLQNAKARIFNSSYLLLIDYSVAGLDVHLSVTILMPGPGGRGPQLSRWAPAPLWGRGGRSEVGGRGAGRGGEGEAS